MPSLALESATDVLDLDYVQKHGRGVQVLAGVTGMGLPPVQVRWLEGAGDGAVFRGRRVLPRDIDLPLLIVGTDRKDFLSLWSRLARMLSGVCKLRMIEDDGTSYWCNVHRVGGGDYALGVDTTGDREVQIVVTLRAPSPYWTAEKPLTTIIGGV